MQARKEKLQKTCSQSLTYHFIFPLMLSRADRRLGSLEGWALCNALAGFSKKALRPRTRASTSAEASFGLRSSGSSDSAKCAAREPQLWLGKTTSPCHRRKQNQDHPMCARPHDISLCK